MMKWSEIRQWSTEKISQRIFFVLIGLSAVVFLLFFGIGYDLPYLENPDFNEPLFTDVLMVLMWLLLIIALGIFVYSVVRTARKVAAAEKMENNVPTLRIRRYTWLGTLGCMVLTFLLGSSATLLVNSKSYTDTFWLRLSDMFIYTSVLLLVVAVGTVIFGATRYIRKDRK